jgi:predicted dehydrogenase
MDGGGAAMNQGIHSIDVLQWLVGPVTNVFARTVTATHDIECEDVAAAVVRFESGALGTITCTTAAYPGFTNDLHLFARDGSIVMSDGRFVRWRRRAASREEEDALEASILGQGQAATDAAAVDPLAIGASGHAALIHDMAAAVRDDRDPLITGEDGLHAIEIVEAIRESAQTGRDVAVRRAATAPRRGSPAAPLPVPVGISG